MTDEATVRGYLDSLGFTLAPHGVRTYHHHRSTDEGPLEIYLRFSDAWMIASIVPFLATRGEGGFELHRWLLRANRDIPLGKFALDEDGDVVLTAELPMESLDRSEVEHAMNALVDAAVTHRRLLRRASSDRPPPR